VFSKGANITRYISYELAPANFVSSFIESYGTEHRILKLHTTYCTYFDSPFDPIVRFRGSENNSRLYGASFAVVIVRAKDWDCFSEALKGIVPSLTQGVERILP